MFKLHLCLVALAVSVLAGCTTTAIPVVPVDAQASFDGNAQNSGLIAFDMSGNGILTAHARDRYNALVADYGAAFKPPVKVDDGITATGTNTFLIDAQHLVYFASMNRWHREGKAPSPTK